MPSGITFTDQRETTEYIEQKFLEGYETERKKVGTNKWKVWIIGKRERTEPRLMHSEELENIMTEHYEGNLTATYRKIRKYHAPVRTAIDIKRIVKGETAKENLPEFEVYVKSEFTASDTDAAVNPPEKKGDKWQIGIHPIHKFSDEDYLREVIKHEIKHIKGKI